MFFQHVYDKSLAQASYFIGCQKDGVAAVIDPRRDVDIYLEIAKANNMAITHIFETHIHADFLSGARELSMLTGASLYLSDEGGVGWHYEFAHRGLRDGSKIQVGNLSFLALHTPGHTPESLSFLLTDHPASPEPVMIFTGDFVFVGDIGRPDLLEKAAGIQGTAHAGAQQMFQSIKKIALLPDHIQLWPGHGAGSACGKSLGAVPSSTIGYEKIRNWAFKFTDDEQGFTNYLLEGQPEPPRYFAMMKKLNKQERPLLTSVPGLKVLTYDDVKAAMAKGIKLIDTRDKFQFAQGFIPGSINIPNNNSLATWAGWLLNYDEPFMVLAAEAAVNEVTRKLMRIGLDDIYGYLPSSISDWSAAGGELQTTAAISVEETKQLIENNSVQVVDLRSATEFETGHIAGAENIFLGALQYNLDKISRDKKVIIHCQGGDRSSVGYSILAKHGFENILNFSGSINEWVKAGEPLAR